MITFKNQFTRKEKSNTVEVARLFQYSNGYRVQYTQTSNDKNDSRLLAGFDKDYAELSQAEAMYADVLETINKGN